MAVNSLKRYIDLESDIGWHNWAVSELIKKYSSDNNSLTAIERMVDDATGAGIDKAIETAKLVRGHLVRMRNKIVKLNNEFGTTYSIEPQQKTIKEINKWLKENSKKNK